jgi:hypothetical protein
MTSKANETSPARWEAAYNVLVTLKYSINNRNKNLSHFEKLFVDFLPWDKFLFFFFQNTLQGI